MDTIELYIAASTVPGTDLLGEVPVGLTGIRQHSYANGFGISGQLGSMKINVSGRRVKIAGSLSRWYLGSNVYQMNRQSIREAIESLSDKLHLPVHKADVTRFDYAENLDMKYPSELYLPYLGAYKGSKKFDLGSTVMFKTKHSQLVFYDKAAEIKSRKESIPQQYVGKNIFRFEKRYSNPSKCLKVEFLTAGMLYDAIWHQRIREDWYKSYTEIAKVREHILDWNQVRSKRDFHAAGDLKLIEELGGRIERWRNLQKVEKRAGSKESRNMI